MEHFFPSRRTGFAPLAFILRRVFKLVPEDVCEALRRVWRTWHPDPEPRPAPKSYGFSNAAKDALRASGINPDDEDEVRAIRERRRARAK